MAIPDSLTPQLREQLPGYTAIVAGHVQAAPGVAYLELARPLRHNSFHEELWAEFPRALRELDASEDTRVIVVSGQGKNFCAGIDVGYLQRNFLALAAAAGGGGERTSPGGRPPPAAASCPGSLRATMRRNILALQDAYSELERCRAPVIAAVHGRCIGGGVDLATACDLRLCSEDATFCVKEVDLAIAADLGTLQRLPYIVGHAAAMDLALTARTVGAAEAHRMGLVTAVAPSQPPPPPAAAASAGVTTAAAAAAPAAAASASGSSGDAGGGGRAAVVAAALRLGGAIASKPALAVQGTKRVLLHSRDQPRVAEGLDYVATWNSAQLISADLAAVFGGGRGGGGGGAAAAGGQRDGGSSARRQEGAPRSRL